MNPFSSEGEKSLTKSRFRDEEQYASNMNAILITITDLESKSVKYYFFNEFNPQSYVSSDCSNDAIFITQKTKMSQDADASMNQTKS